MSANKTESLFSYGTLQTEQTQQATFGRKLEGARDVLNGYRLSTVEISNPAFVQKSGAAIHRNIQKTGLPSDKVEGTLLQLTPAELQQADDYEEGSGYERIVVELGSGARAWVYLRCVAC